MKKRKNNSEKDYFVPHNFRPHYSKTHKKHTLTTIQKALLKWREGVPIDTHTNKKNVKWMFRLCAFAPKGLDVDLI